MSREGWDITGKFGALLVVAGIADILAGEFIESYENGPTLDIVLIVVGLVIAAVASRMNHEVGTSGCSRCGGSPVSMYYTGYGWLCAQCARRTNFS